VTRCPGEMHVALGRRGKGEAVALRIDRLQAGGRAAVDAQVRAIHAADREGKAHVGGHQGIHRLAVLRGARGDDRPGDRLDAALEQARHFGGAQRMAEDRHFIERAGEGVRGTVAAGAEVQFDLAAVRDAVAQRVEPGGRRDRRAVDVDLHPRRATGSVVGESDMMPLVVEHRHRGIHLEGDGREVMAQENGHAVGVGTVDLGADVQLPALVIVAMHHVADDRAVLRAALDPGAGGKRLVTLELDPVAGFQPGAGKLGRRAAVGRCHGRCVGGRSVPRGRMRGHLIRRRGVELPMGGQAGLQAGGPDAGKREGEGRREFHAWGMRPPRAAVRRVFISGTELAGFARGRFSPPRPAIPAVHPRDLASSRRPQAAAQAVFTLSHSAVHSGSLSPRSSIGSHFANSSSGGNSTSLPRKSSLR
jgi:hypothetical protein